MTGQLQTSMRAPGLFIPEGTDVLLAGRPHTTRKRISFTSDRIVAQNDEYATVELIIEGHIWMLIAPLAAVCAHEPPRPEQLTLGLLDPDLPDEEAAIQALRDSAPAIRLHGAANMVSVPSDSDPNRAYTVLLSDHNKASACTCDDHTYRRRRCKHMRRAELIDMWDEAVEALLERGVPAEAILQGWHTHLEGLGAEAAMLRLIAAGQVAGLSTAGDAEPF